MYYNFSTYDPRLKSGQKNQGKQSYGQPQAIYFEPKNSLLSILQDNDDDIDEELSEEESESVASKINYSFTQPRNDPGRKRTDARPGTNQPFGLMEYSGDHTHYATPGISPYRQPPHTAGAITAGGAEQIYRTTGNYKRTGTLQGFSKPHKKLTPIDDRPIFNLSDMDDPMERSFLRQQNQIKRILNTINEELKR